MDFVGRLAFVVSVATAVSTSAAASTAAAQTANERICESFTAYSPGELREVHFTDLDGDGVTVGDKRIGRRVLNDAEGNKIGERFWVFTVRAIDDDGNATSLSVEHVNVLNGGVVFSSLQNVERGNVRDAEETILPREGYIATVVGGTAAYAGARGTIEVERDGLDFTYLFELTCE